MKNGTDEVEPTRYETISMQVEAGLAMYGSTDNWPTLRLDANAFTMCVCGKKRLQHKIGADSSPFVPTGKTTHECHQFTWAAHGLLSNGRLSARRRRS